MQYLGAISKMTEWSQFISKANHSISQSVQFSSVTQSCLTLCDPVDCSTLCIPVHHQLPELTQTHVHRVGDAIQSSHPQLSPSPPAFNLSQEQGLFKWISSSHQVARLLERQHQFFQWIFRTDFLVDWLVWSPYSPRDSQESSPIPQFKSSILQCLAFFIVQLSHPYMTTGKTIALIRQTSTGKVTSLLFNMLSRLVINFSSKEQVTFNFMAVVTISSDLRARPPKKKSITVSIVSLSICHEVVGWDAMILVFECWALSQLFTLLFHFHHEVL